MRKNVHLFSVYHSGERNPFRRPEPIGGTPPKHKIIGMNNAKGSGFAETFNRAGG